jgi:diguanylate cyclase (GGDEF)-like protein
MSSGAETASSREGPGRVLLVGDVRGAFVDGAWAAPYPCEVTGSLLDAVDHAARGDFGVIGIVMEGTAGHLHAALRALRQGTRARIILLARMHEEPIARLLVAHDSLEERLADEYLVCPTRVALLHDRAVTAASRSPVEDPTPPTGPAETAKPAAPADGSDRADIAQLEEKIRRLEHLATTDDLTGLKNRRYVMEFARQALERAGRGGGRVTLLLFDIDDFKHYNDAYGHLMGDEILRQAGILMRRCCRPHDVVARVGGDEFAVVFWDGPYQAGRRRKKERRSAATDHPAGAISVAKRFQKELGNADLHLLGPRGQGVLTISGGLASFPRDGATVHDLFERADRALLEAKRDGKNRIYLVGEPGSDIADIN